MSKGKRQKARQRGRVLRPMSAFMLLILSRIWRAIFSFPIALSPVPSTSQYPPCPMFHMPVLPDSENANPSSAGTHTNPNLASGPAPLTMVRRPVTAATR